MGIVSAAMKKSVSYNVKVVVEKIGEITSTSCDCPAGLGPHGTCKHLTATILVLSDFVQKGDLKVVKSCTQTLQTFQKPTKLHCGSPIKAENLGKRPFEGQDEDPRPKHLRNRPSFIDEVRSKTVNFVYQAGLDLAMRYTFPKANLSTAVSDHDYLKRPYTEY